MTNNTDEFEQDQFDTEEGMDPPQRDVKKTLMEAWREKPIFKLVVIMGVVGVMMAGALGAFSSKPQVEAARLAATPGINEAPGGKASPFFIEQNKEANDQRVKEALENKGSAMPTPVGPNIDLADLSDKNRKDPLLEFRAETERLRDEMRAEQRQSNQQMQALQAQLSQRSQQEDDSLAKAMQRQMEELMESWKPRKIGLVAGTATLPKETASTGLVEGVGLGGAQAALLQGQSLKRPKPVVPAGTVSYMQLLTEANSDVPGPILGQILSGPLAGARAVGRFQVMNDYLVLTFHLVSIKGKEYPIEALALDPDTTLGGLATEVDHRYFARVLLPAAASFMQAFGSALSEGSSQATVAGDSVVVTQAKKGYDDATYAGLGQVGQTLSQFFQNEANQIKPLVRVAVGTPMGLFFLSAVRETTDDLYEQQQQQQNFFAAQGGNLTGLLARGYQQGGAALTGMTGASQTGTGGLTGYGAATGTSTAVGGTTSVPYNTSGYGTGASGYNPMMNMNLRTGTTNVYNPAQMGMGSSVYYMK